MKNSAARDPITALPWLVDFAEAGAEQLPELGGKGARLAELLQAGFRVPNGTCVTRAAFRSFLVTTGLDARIAALGDDLESCAPIRAAIEETPVPEDLRAQIVAAYGRLGDNVAVRSSALGEDSESASFAGQHDTYLDVRGDDAVVDAVRRCWASLWSERAWTYRQVEGVDTAREIAVVIQEMVDADSAGVLFTADPITGQNEKLILESCWGLGEGLVAGRVTTDSFVIERRDLSIEQRRIRYKATRMVPAGGGETRLADLPTELREAPSLGDDSVRELGRLGVDLARRYGSEQDIEWAEADGVVYLLQSRPITTRPALRAGRMTPDPSETDPHLRDNTLWSRMDIGEIFNGIMTPLGISFGRYYQFNVHGDCVRTVGNRVLGDPMRYMGFMQGHVYLNVSYSAFLLSQQPPTRDQSRFTNRFSSEEVDLAKYRNPYGMFPGGLDFAKSALFWLRATLKELATMQTRAEKMVASRFEEYDRFRTLRLESFSKARLEAEMNRSLEYFREMHFGYMPYYINAFAFYGILEEVCHAWMGDEGVGLQNRLKSDMSNLRTLESVRDILELVEVSRKYAGVEELIRETTLSEVEAALAADPEGRRFWSAEVEPFMRVNGVRARQDMELTRPRWLDDTSYLFQMMRKYYVHNVVMDDVLERSGSVRAADSEQILARLPLPKRKFLQGVIRLYSTCSELREQVRMAMCTSIWMVRSIVYELGRRFVDDGILRSMDEVAYLDFFDLVEYLRGDRPARQCFPRSKIEESRRAHLHYLRLPEPPLTFIGTYDPSTAKYDNWEGDSERIEGLGTSPGRVVARARVIHDLVRQSDELEPGEVLVTGFTDAAWTPLFLLASAVVTDIGSMLSHSSIVSREFNIPSVVNTKVATKTIKTGDMLIVDGDTGVVEIQSA